VCDAFVAIISARTYRAARTKEEALAELQRCAGAQFDPAVVVAFCRLLDAPQAGAQVQLDEGAPTGRAADSIGRILAVAREQLGMDAAVLCEFAGDRQVFRWVDADDRFGLTPDSSIPLADSYCRRLLDNRVPNVIRDARNDERVRDLDVTRDLGIGAYVGVPIKLRDGSVYGALSCISREPRPALSDPDVRLLHELGHIVSAELEIQDNKARTESTGIRALVAALGARDHSIGLHSDMVVALAGRVAAELGLGVAEQSEVRQIAGLHDIGKVGVPDHILHKPGPLDASEWQIMRQHPVIGAGILRSTETLAHLAPAVRAEHERWDGTGYPDGLAGDEIPLSSRIVLVCDAYHAMTSDRPYRRAMTADAAIGELRDNAGTQFDAAVVDAFVAVVGRRGTRPGLTRV
jgi:HD-GYP domain-containing protein (c-di-GMP phosphodiesterase class II)